MYQFKRGLSMLLATILLLNVLPIISLASNDGVGMNNFVERNTYTAGQFNDIKDSDWFAGNVKTVFELGLMNGKGNGSFDPNGNVTIAELITIAARLHAIYNTGSDAFPTSDPWYMAYYDYATKYELLPIADGDINTPAARWQVSMILAKALPDNELEEINQVAIDAIPDVKSDEFAADAIYKFYRAGIMSGSDDVGTFQPNANVKRSEVAAVISRMVNKDLRKSVALLGPNGWNILFVVLTDTSLNTYDKDEQRQIDISYQMTEKEYEAICKSATDFEKDLTEKSEGNIDAYVTVVRCDEEISEYEKAGFGYYITNKAAKEYLTNQNIDVTAYDHVIFVTSFPDLPRSYFGLGGTFIQGYRGFSLIVYGSGVMSPTEYCYNISKTNWPAGLYIHEFLHSVESYGRYLNMKVPSPDGAETYGYQNVDHWRNYYTDIINNRVPFEDGYIGVNPELWKMQPRFKR